MSIYYLAAVVVGVGLVAWLWLSRPLWYACEDQSLLESFLTDLVSHQSPWPVVEIHDSKRHRLTYRRSYAESGAFRLELERPGQHTEPEDLGLVAAGNVSVAADAGRTALSELGSDLSPPLRVRYEGPMDQRVVSRLRPARRESAV